MAGYSMKQHIERVEREELMPFLSVLKGLAAGGESKSAAAEILDIPQTTLCKWLRDNPQCIEWPAKNSSNGFYGNVMNNTPARQAARLRNLSLTTKRKKRSTDKSGSIILDTRKAAD